MKILSYSFFDPIHLPSHRFWDDYKNEISRYYYNIPAVILTNKILYPDYITRIYITKNTLDNPLCEVFNLFDDINIFVVNMQYNLTEPSILRMMPLWEDNIVEIFHTRDIDSLPTEIEYRFTRAFENKNYGIGTLRTHENHYGYGCRMLAGLSSFRPSLVPTYIKGNSFIDYFYQSHNRYGCDQDLMIKTFTENNMYTVNNFYDCKAYSQNNNQDFPCISCLKDELDSIIVEEDKLEILNILKKNELDSWAGKPIDARGNFTNFVLSKFPQIQNKLLSNTLLKNFYGL